MWNNDETNMKNDSNVKKLPYGKLTEIAKELNVSVFKVRDVLHRMRRDFDNFYSLENKKIHQRLLNELNNE